LYVTRSNLSAVGCRVAGSPVGLGGVVGWESVEGVADGGAGVGDECGGDTGCGGVLFGLVEELGEAVEELVEVVVVVHCC